MRALYTITNETAQVRYAGNGVTKTFSVPFQFFETTTLRVRQLIGDLTTTLTLGLDYEATGGAGSTGAVVLMSSAQSGSTLIIDLDMPATQETIDLGPNGPLPAEDVEQGFDRVVTLVKQLRQELQAVPSMVPSFNPDAGPAPTLPEPIAQNLLIGKTDETGWENITLQAVAAAVAAFSPVTNPGTIPVVGTGDAATDTAAMTAAVAAASVTGLIVEPVGTIVLRIPSTPSWTYLQENVHICVPLVSNVHVRATGARFKIEAPTFSMPSTSRVFMFGTTTKSTTAGTYKNITWDGGVFDFNNTYGTVPGFAYAFGVVSVDNFHRRNILFETPGDSARAGRGLFSFNCRNRTGINLRYYRIVQGYFTRYEDGVSDLATRFDSCSECYDVDGVARNVHIIDMRAKDITGERQVLDLASLQNSMICGLHCDNVASALYLYVKQTTAWPTYAQYDKHVTGAPPTVTLDAPTGVFTWPGDYDLVADGKVVFDWSGAPPAEYSETKIYYIVGSSISGNSASVSATKGGAAIVPSGAGTGTITATRYADTPEICKNVLVSGVTGINLYSSGDDTIRISAYRGDWDWEDCPVQCDNITLRDISLDGGNFVRVNEGRVKIRNMRLENFSPGTSTANGQGSALSILQSTQNASRIAESAVHADVEDVEIINSQGRGVTVDSASFCRLRNIRVNGYNLQNVSVTARGVAVTGIGRKNGSWDIDGLNIITTTDNATDLLLDEHGSVAAGGYKFAIGEDLRLRTTATGFVNLSCDLARYADDRKTYQLPSYDTTGSAIHVDTLLQSAEAYFLFLGGSVTTHDAIAGDAVNNSRIQWRRSVAGVLSGITNASVAIDATAQTADTERRVNADSTDPDCRIAPGEALVAVTDAANGTGTAALPKMQVRVAAIKYFKT